MIITLIFLWWLVGYISCIFNWVVNDHLDFKVDDALVFIFFALLGPIWTLIALVRWFYQRYIEGKYITDTILIRGR